MNKKLNAKKKKVTICLSTNVGRETRVHTLTDTCTPEQHTALHQLLCKDFHRMVRIWAWIWI